jgi:hypothetical protein
MMNLPHAGFTSPSEWNPDIHDDSQTTDEMTRQVSAVPKDAVNELYYL